MGSGTEAEPVLGRLCSTRGGNALGLTAIAEFSGRGTQQAFTTRSTAPSAPLPEEADLALHGLVPLPMQRGDSKDTTLSLSILLMAGFNSILIFSLLYSLFLLSALRDEVASPQISYPLPPHTHTRLPSQPSPVSAAGQVWSQIQSPELLHAQHLTWRDPLLAYLVPEVVHWHEIYQHEILGIWDQARNFDLELWKHSSVEKEAIA